VRFTKISVNLTEEVLQALREMAQRDSITLTEALRRSVSTRKFLEDEQRAGKWILIEDPRPGRRLPVRAAVPASCLSSATTVRPGSHVTVKGSRAASRSAVSLARVSPKVGW
jgi:hypothetical protein